MLQCSMRKFELLSGSMPSVFGESKWQTKLKNSKIFTKDNFEVGTSEVEKSSFHLYKNLKCLNPILQSTKNCYTNTKSKVLQTRQLRKI